MLFTSLCSQTHPGPHFPASQMAQERVPGRTLMGRPWVGMGGRPQPRQCHPERSCAQRHTRLLSRPGRLGLYPSHSEGTSHPRALRPGSRGHGSPCAPSREADRLDDGQDKLGSEDEEECHEIEGAVGSRKEERTAVTAAPTHMAGPAGGGLLPSPQRHQPGSVLTLMLTLGPQHGSSGKTLRWQTAGCKGV